MKTRSVNFFLFDNFYHFLLDNIINRWETRPKAFNNNQFKPAEVFEVLKPSIESNWIDTFEVLKPSCQQSISINVSSSKIILFPLCCKNAKRSLIDWRISQTLSIYSLSDTLTQNLVNLKLTIKQTNEASVSEVTHYMI